MKKGIALLLAGMLLLPMFAACGDDKAPAVTTASSEETVVTKDPNTPDIPSPEEIGDISGEFRILVAGNYAFNDFKSEGEEGTAVDTAIYRRNAYLKDKYNIDIAYDEILGFMRINGSGEGYMKIASDHMAGNHTYDAASIGTWDVATLAYSGYIHDLNDKETMKYIDLTKPYWDQRANEDLMIRNKMYYTTGDISLVDNMSTNAILFNKGMRAAYGLDDPYELVRSGDWTLEKFIELARAVGEDAIRTVSATKTMFSV